MVTIATFVNPVIIIVTGLAVASYHYRKWFLGNTTTFMALIFLGVFGASIGYWFSALGIDQWILRPMLGDRMDSILGLFLAYLFTLGIALLGAHTCIRVFEMTRNEPNRKD